MVAVGNLETVASWGMKAYRPPNLTALRAWVKAYWEPESHSGGILSAQRSTFGAPDGREEHVAHLNQT